MKPNNDLVAEFRKLLDSCDSENSIQIFLEKHAELIPLPFLAGHQLHQSAVISKLPIGNSFICDLAYLTKCSDYWNIVFIELEKPTKKIFLETQENVRTRAEFNQAYEQVQSWKAYLENSNHLDELKKRISKLMGDGLITRIPFYARYVLIYGRSEEKNSSEKRIELFNQKNTESILVKTYDSIISEYLAKPIIPKMILTLWKDNGFQIKNIPEQNLEMSLLGYLNSDFIKFDNNIKNKLISQGYCIEQWEKGNLLTQDGGKLDKQTKINSLPPNNLIRRILESEK